jgi:hypothetical protein
MQGKMFRIYESAGVTGYGVAKRKPDAGSWIRESDLFTLRV